MSEEGANQNDETAPLIGDNDSTGSDDNASNNESANMGGSGDKGGETQPDGAGLSSSEGAMSGFDGVTMTKLPYTEGSINGSRNGNHRLNAFDGDGKPPEGPGYVIVLSWSFCLFACI